MTALRITALYPCTRRTPTKDIDERAPQPEDAAMHADVLAAPTPSPQTKDEDLRNRLLTALDAAQAPNATTADQVVTRFEAVRHWVPQFKAWLRHPQRAEAFFQQTPWPAMDPVTAGVLLGLTYRSRTLAETDTAANDRGERQRLALAEATYHGLMNVPGMQAYAPIMTDVAAAECRQPAAKSAMKFSARTNAALVSDREPPSDLTTARKTAFDIAIYPRTFGRYDKVKAAPAPISWEQNLPEIADTSHLEELQSSIVSLIQYHNMEITGQEVVFGMRKLVASCAQSPALLANLQFCAGPMSLGNDFLAGALVGTLYLGMLRGLQDLYGTRNRTPKARMLACYKLISERVHKAMADLPTAFDAYHWGEMAFIVRESIDAGVQPREIRSRLDTYTNIMEQAAKADPVLSQQWYGLRWRLVTYPAMKL